MAGVQTACGPLSGWYRRSGATLSIHIAGRVRHEIGYRSSCQGIDYQLLLGRVRSFKADGDSLVDPAAGIVAAAASNDGYLAKSSPAVGRALREAAAAA